MMNISYATYHSHHDRIIQLDLDVLHCIPFVLNYEYIAQVYDFSTNHWNVTGIWVIWGRGGGHLGFLPGGHGLIIKSYSPSYSL